MGAFLSQNLRGRCSVFCRPAPTVSFYHILCLHEPLCLRENQSFSASLPTGKAIFSSLLLFLFGYISLFFLPSEAGSNIPFLCKTENLIQRDIKFKLFLARKFVKKIVLILYQIYPLSPVKLFITLWIMWITSLEEAFLPLNTHLLRPKL